MPDLLIMSCSAGKIASARPADTMPAINRYDGPTFRTLRANRPLELDVVILSAAYGFLDEAALIVDYNRKLDKAAARAILLNDNRAVGFAVDHAIDSGGAVYLYGSKLYRGTMMAAIGLERALELDRAGRLFYSQGGGIGEQLGQLKAWLAIRAVRCIQCGQPDEPEHHRADLCAAALERKRQA